MTFSLSHWKNPRKTIATKYEKDDFAYAIHGAHQAVEVLKHLNLRPSEAAKMVALDYGCGTGRIARVMSPMFSWVFAWDPVQECVEQGYREGANLPKSGMTLTHRWDDVRDARFDVIVSVNVIEHLTPADQRAMISRIKSVAKPGSRLLLWYDIKRNAEVLAENFSDYKIAEDDAVLAARPTARINVREFRL